MFKKFKSRLNEQAAPSRQENSGLLRSFSKRSKNTNFDKDFEPPPAHEILHTISEHANSPRSPNGTERWSTPNPVNGPVDPRQPPYLPKTLRKPLPSPPASTIINTSSPTSPSATTYAPLDRTLTRAHYEHTQAASPTTIRHLRSLIRERYALDIHIWSKRSIHRANRKMLIPKCQRADDVLRQIYGIVNSWEQEYFNDEEWRMVQKIRGCLAAKRLENGDSNEPALWMRGLPWDRERERGRVDSFG